jgi:hypothetical protein
VYAVTAESEGTTVCRVSLTEIIGRISRVQMEYIIGTAGGLRRESEVHELGLFTRAEMESSFLSAGLSAEFDPEGVAGRGLYLAKGTG